MDDASKATPSARRDLSNGRIKRSIRHGLVNPYVLMATIKTATAVVKLIKAILELFGGS
ncbi:MAG: hypothetical protein WCK05_12730 [Planctomycetota bacterium]